MVVEAVAAVVVVVVIGTNIREHIKLEQVAPAGIPGDGERRSTWQDQGSTSRSDRKSSPGKRSRSRSTCSNRPARTPTPRPPPPPSRTMPPNPHSRRPKSGLVKGGAKLWRKASQGQLGGARPQAGSRTRRAQGLAAAGENPGLRSGGRIFDKDRYASVVRLPHTAGQNKPAASTACPEDK